MRVILICSLKVERNGRQISFNLFILDMMLITPCNLVFDI